MPILAISLKSLYFLMLIELSKSGLPKLLRSLRRPVVRGNSLYTIVDGPSWTQAEVNALKLGGHLVTINNSNENEFIYSNEFLYPNAFRWIGINDIEQERVYKWVSGEESDYREWVSSVEDGDPGR